MTKNILIDEFHLSMLAPAEMPDQAYRSIRRALNERRFQVDLRRAARSVARAYPSLSRVTVRLSR